MTELRWGLLVLGLVALVATYLYTRHRTIFRRKFTAMTRRLEPALHQGQSSPGSPSDPSALSSGLGKVITVRMMAREQRGFRAEQLILALRDAGLRHGQFGIFHKLDADSEGTPGFSVASLVEPGSFDLKRVKTEYYPGVSIFMSLPGPRDGVMTFDQMLETSRALAKKMDGELLDEHGSSLSIQRERYIREEVIQFEHQGLRS